ncbi:IclR family transcriptional regulator [Ramlibacter sp.]|uniref:IclR family transcriptional regulator n=1 Tax=Ramlibacter sp. TaxID=1917967 RepID=UPI003D12CFEB
MAAAEHRPDRGAESADGAQSVRRALGLLRLVASAQESGVRLTDLAQLSGLSRPTVHRLLKVLADETAIEQDAATKRYLLGPELWLLGLARTGRFPIGAIAQPYLQALADEIGDTVFLSVRHGNDSVCIERFLGTHPIQVLSIAVGVRRPLGGSVSGIVLLGGMPPAQAKAITSANEARLALQGIAASEVLRQIRAMRGLGYAYAPQGVMPGTSAVAAPIRAAGGQFLAAVSVAALSPRLEGKRVADIVSRLGNACDMITRRHTEVAEHALKRNPGGARA